MIRFGENAPVWLGLGWVIALVVLVVTIVFLAISSLDYKIGGLIIGLALARLL